MLLGDNMNVLRKLDAMHHDQQPIHSCIFVFNLCSVSVATMPQSPHSPAPFWGALRINPLDSTDLL